MYIFRYLKNTMGKMDIGGKAACGSWQVENTTPQITEGLLELEDINFADLFTPPTLAQPLPLVEQRPYENPRTIPNKEKKRIIKKKSVSIKKKHKAQSLDKKIFKDPKTLHDEIQKFRNPIVINSAKYIFCAKPQKQTGSEDIYSKDMVYRAKSIDQLDYLAKLLEVHMYFLRKLGIIVEIEKICDILNNFIYEHIKFCLISKNTVIVEKVIDIEETGICSECISGVVALLKLSNKNHALKKIETCLVNSNWSSLPSDYAKYTEKYISPCVINETSKILF